MPRIHSTSTNGKSITSPGNRLRGNEVPSVPQSPITQALTEAYDKLPRSDRVVIAHPDYEDDPAHDTASWADIRKEAEGIRWLVRDYIPAGMLTGVVGQPKQGKSAWVLGAIVRPLITGTPFFNGQLGFGEPGHVVWAETEYKARVNLERAKAWGLPDERILAPFADKHQVIDLENMDHIYRVINVVCRYRARAVILDAFRGSHSGDENSSKIAIGLQKFAKVAAETNTATIAIHHAKQLRSEEDVTLNVARGSNAFLASVAVQIFIDVPDSGSEPANPWRRLQVLGTNLGAPPAPCGFRFGTGGLEFGSAPRKVEATERVSKKGAAAVWLRCHMLPGKWYRASSLEELAKRFGHSKDNLFRARQELGITLEAKTVRKKGDSWLWQLPG